LVKQLKRLGYPLRQLQIHGNGEPLMNKHIITMVAEASKAGIAESIRVTTNGTMLYSNVVSGLIAAGVTEIWVSLDAADSELYKHFKGRSRYFTVRENILAAIPIIEKAEDVSLVIKYPVATSDNAYGITKEYGESVMREFGRMAENSWQIHLIGMPVVVMTGGEKRYTTPCEIPFYSLFVKFDGRVSLCCADYKDYLTIGHIAKESIRQLVGGKSLRTKRMKHLEGDWAGMEICGNCGNRTCVNMDEIKIKLREMI